MATTHELAEVSVTDMMYVETLELGKSSSGLLSVADDQCLRRQGTREEGGDCLVSHANNSIKTT